MTDGHAGIADIVSANAPAGWLVTGFFTPDYRPLVQKLAAGLDAVAAPYHFYGVERQGGWRSETLRKPSIIAGAMRQHAGQTIVVMDADCTVRAPLAPMADIASDVACFMHVKKRGPRQYADLSSRVIVLRPTPGARRLIESWARLCEEHPDSDGDEPLLIVALAQTPGVSWTPLDAHYAGRELGSEPAGAAIVHSSQREASSLFRRLKRLSKTWRRKWVGRTTESRVRGTGA